MLLPNPVGNHTNTEFPWYTASRDFRCSSFSVRLGIPNLSRKKDSAEEKVSLLPAINAALSYSTAYFVQLLMITSRVMTFWTLRMHGQNTVYQKLKLAHAYTADTRLSSSSPPRALLESLGTRLASKVLVWYTLANPNNLLLGINDIFQASEVCIVNEAYPTMLFYCHKASCSD